MGGSIIFLSLTHRSNVHIETSPFANDLFDIFKFIFQTSVDRMCLEPGQKTNWKSIV